MGGRALYKTLTSPQFEVVGVKVFSPHKHGMDIGTLVGLPPVGVKATTSKQEILALKADCVIHTPTTPALIEGADLDVLDLLASGKNVVSGASHHNPSMLAVRIRASAGCTAHCQQDESNRRCVWHPGKASPGGIE